MPYLVRTIAVIASCLATLAASCVAASANITDYAVTTTPADGAPAWSRALIPGFTATSPETISIAYGARLLRGSRAELILRVPSSDLRLRSGKVSFSAASVPRLGADVRLRDASRDRSLRSVTTSPDLTSYEATFEHESASELRTGLFAVDDSTMQRGELKLQLVELTVRDTTSPERLAIDHPRTWVAPHGCVPVTIRAEDDDSGIANASIVGTTGVLDSWSTPLVPAFMAGPRQVTWTPCVPATARVHGTQTFTAHARNPSGISVSNTFELRTDALAPIIDGGPENDAALEAPYRFPSIRIDDVGSGLAGVSAHVDGHQQSLIAEADGSYTFEDPQLSIGGHVIELRAVDAVGNETVSTRRIHVADRTPPAISMSSPDNGPSSFDLELAASDEVSGVRASSWIVTVNGIVAPGSADADRFVARVGPLATGTHRIDVAVSDLAGNQRRSSFTYVVHATSGIPADIAAHMSQLVSEQVAQTPRDPSASNIAGSSAASVPISAWIVRGRSVRARFGSPNEVTIFIARAGQPVPGRRVHVEQRGTLLAIGTSNEHGLATLRYGVTSPGAPIVVVDDVARLPITAVLSPYVRLTSRSSSAARNARVLVRGRVQPGGPFVVQLEARAGRGGWFVVRRSVPTTRSGAFTIRFRANARGTYELRARTRPSHGWAAGESAPIKLRVR